MIDQRRTWCGLCHPKCGILLHFEDGRAIRVQGDPEHPINRGRICERGALMIEHLYHPERLNHAMKRVGERGEGRWQRIPYDQALDEVADRLAALKSLYGAETLSFCHGTARTYHWDQRRFFNLFGSPNYFGANNICMCPSVAVDYATYGCTTPHGDLENARCIVIAGAAPSQSDPILQYPRLVRAKQRGARLIVIDPRRIPEADLADFWLPILPGTDVALFLGWIRLILTEGLHDTDFVRDYTIGLDDLRHAAEPYTPERVAEITTISPDLVVGAARMYASTRPAVFGWGFGIDKQGVNATQSARARAILRAITGNLDVPGGEPMGWSEPIGRIVPTMVLEASDQLSTEQRQKQLGRDRHPMMTFAGYDRNVTANARLPRDYMHPPFAGQTCVAHARSVLDAMLTGSPYPVRALICSASNPLLSLPDARYTHAALHSLDLLVVNDYYLTPSASLADYVFPAACTVERNDLWFTPGFVIACPRALEPLHERRDDYQFWRGLAIRLGQESHWPWETVEQVFDFRLAPLGLSFESLLKQGPLFGKREHNRYRQWGFGTPSGKVELRSSIFSDLGLPAVPVFRDVPGLSQVLAAEFPLILITGSRFMPMYHSEQRQIASARKRVPDPLCLMHPQTAQNLGLADGDWVDVFSPSGRMKARLEWSDRIQPGMADVHHGWWFPERKATEPHLFGVFESNANTLCPGNHDVCSMENGSWPHTGLRCRVEKSHQPLLSVDGFVSIQKPVAS